MTTSSLAVFILSVSAVACFANPMFFGSLTASSGGGATPGLTVGTNWPDATCSSASACFATSATETLSGVTTTLKFSGDNGQYSKNGGAFTSFSDGATVSFTNSDTLAFKTRGLIAGGDSSTITVTDNSNGGLVGSFTGENTHG